MTFTDVLLAAVFTVLISPAHAFWRLTCSTVQVGRVDPIVNPGGIASHCHTIAGPVNINTTSTFAGLQAAYCTSCAIQKDKSAYWTPNLYYRYRNATYQEITNDGTIVYYLDRGTQSANLTAFPPGFRMVSGDSNARAYDPKTLTYGGNPSYPSHPISDRVTFACLDYNNPMPETNGFNVTRCSSGLRAQVHFQSCWDGVNLYKSDQSHVAYLSGIDNGVCPPTHPKLLPHLFIELYYNVNAIDPTIGGMFVFSNGDTTGYGFHGDFLNGWDPDVLQTAMNTCMGPKAVNQGQFSLCPALNASVDPFYSRNCPEQPSLVNEASRGQINILPGCNPPTGGPAKATNPQCPVQPNTIPGIASAFDYNNRSVPVPGNMFGNWTYMGCATDSQNARVLTGTAYTDNNNLTMDACTAYCKSKGFILAGMENGVQCYCGNNLASPILSPAYCSAQNCIVCSGNDFQYCGAPNLIQVWNDTGYAGPTVKPPPTAGVTTLNLPSGGTALYAGCYMEGSGFRALSGGNYINATSMTLETCAAYCQSRNFKLFGTEYSQECYCGNSISTISVSQGNCTFPCAGDKTELCGAGQRLSVWSLPGSVQSPGVSGVSSTTVTGAATSSAPAVPTPSASGISYINCYSETIPRALTGSFTDNATMSIDTCARLAQSLNAKLFGLEYSSQCLTGSTLNGGSAVIDSSKCNKACAGNPAQICGGANAISLFSNTMYVNPVNPNPVSVPGQNTAQYGYAGCYNDPSTARVLGATSGSSAYMTTFSTPMTVEACAVVCFNKGYSFMGVEFGSECFCNNAGPVTGATLSANGDADCSTLCSGNATEYCGASNKINVYQIKTSSGRVAMGGKGKMI